MNYTNTLFSRIATLVAFGALLIAAPAHAAGPASDNASAAPYGDGWQNGDNGGSGFNAWSSLNPGGNTGFFIGNSANNGSGAGSSPNIGNPAWGVFANNNNTAEARRQFGGGATLQDGQTFTIDMDSGFDDGANTSGGFGLQNSGNGTRFELFHRAGQANYEINDSAVNFNTGIPFTDGGLRVVFTLTSVNTYNVTITRLNNGLVTTFTGRTLGNTAGTRIDRVRLFRYNNFSGGSARDYFFNNMAISCASAPATAISGPSTACASVATTYSNSGNNSGTRTWSLSANTAGAFFVGGVNSGTSVQINTTQTGSYTLTLVNTLSGCSQSANTTVTVLANPTPAPSNNGPVCAGQPVTLMANTVANSYTWTGPGGFSSSAQNPVVSPAVAGTYNLSVTYQNGCPSVAAGSTVVAVDPAPACSISGPSGVCPGAQASFSGPVVGSPSYSWSVSGNGTIVGAANGSSVTVDAGSSGSYTVSLTLTENGCSSTCSQVVVIDGVAPTINCSAPALANASFETGGPCGSQVINNWTIFGNGYHECSTPRSGAFFAKTFGNWNGSPDFTGLFQDLAAAPGQTWRGSVYVLVPGNDVPAGGSHGKLRIEFLNSSFGLITGHDAPVTVGASMPKDVYVKLVVTATAPAGTAWIRIVPTYVQLNFGGGSVFFDDASLTRLTVVSADAGCQGVIPDLTSLASASDNNGTVTVTQVPAAGTVAGLGDHVVTLTATDGCGNQSSCSYTVSVVDDTAPSLSCPAPVTIECDASSAPANTGNASAADTCSSPVAVSSVDSATAGSCGQESVITRTWTARDAAGNFAQCVQTITREDTTAPVITGGPADLALSCPTDIPAAPAARAWSLYANNGNVSDAVRPLSAPLAVGQTLKLDLDNGYIFPGSTVGFGLRNAADENRFEVFFVGGQATYRVKGDGASVASSIGFSGEGIHIEVTLTSADTFSVRLVRLQDGSEQTLTGTLGGTAGSAITKLRFFNADSGSGVSHDAFYNSIEVPGVAFDSASSAAYDDGWQNGDNGGTGFGPWQLSPATDNNFAGNIIGNSTANDGGDTNNDGDINSLPVTASDNCDPHVNVAFSQTDNGAAGCAGSPRIIVRTWTATDDCGNTTTHTQTITQEDDSTPVLANVPSNVTVQCAAAIPAPPSAARAWGLYANSGALSEALRDFNVDLAIGQTFSLDIDNGNVGAGGTVGFGLQNGSSGQNRLELYFVGGSQFYVVDAAGIQSTGIEFSREGIHIDLTLTSADTYAITVTRLSGPSGAGPAKATLTGTLSGTAGSAVNRIRYFNSNAGAGQAFDLFFNHLGIAGVASDNASDAAYDDGWQSGDNGGTGFGPWVLQGSGGSAPANYGRFVGNSLQNNNPAFADSNGDGDINSLSVTASDACDTHVAVSYSQTDNGASGCAGSPRIIVRTWTATDDCGNTTSQSQTITQEDTQAPVLSGVPSDTTVQCFGDIPAPPSVTASDNCNGAVSVQFAQSTSGSQVTRTWTATDSCGNTVTATQVITVEDTIAPSVTCPADVTVQCSDSTDPSSTGSATATDNCDPAPAISHADVETAGSCPQEKTITRTWAATDAEGNASTCVQTITLVDTIAPVLSVPADATIACDADSSPATTGQASATDNCDGFPSITFSDSVAGGSCPQSKTITRTWTATDDCGNSASAVQTITTLDGAAPAIYCQAVDGNVLLNASFENGGPAGTQVIDNWSIFGNGYRENFNPHSGLFHAKAFGNWLGDPDFTGVFQDAPASAGQVWRASVYAFISPFDIPANGSFGKLRIEFFDAGNGFLGAQDAPVTVDATSPIGVHILLAVTATAPANTAYVRIVPTYVQIGLGSGSVFFDDARLEVVQQSVNVQCAADIPAPDTSLIMAQDNCDLFPTILHVGDVSNGGSGCAGDPLVITRTYRAVDACGNSSECSISYNVADTVAPVLADVPADATASCDAIPAPAAVTASDNCDTSVAIAFSETSASGSCANGYTIVRTWTATDDCGNSSVASQSITVEDTTAPTLALPADATIECGTDSSPAATGEATATDNCDTAPTIAFSDSAAAGSCPQESLITRTWTATDACGNTASAVQLITVEDTTAPTLALPADATIECGTDSSPAATGEATATDNCDTAVTIAFSDSVAAGSCPQGSQITRTWTATDACGNTSTGTQVITIQDTTAPAVAAPASVTVQCDDPTDPSATGTATATDNCDDSVAVASKVWINEFHYDNTGTDTNEFIELAGLAGTDLSGCHLVLYNGANGLSYNTVALSGIIDDEGCGYGAISIPFPANGIQNDVDGFAVALCLGPGGVQFLSYEGTFTAVNGPAAGMTSTDVGVSENGPAPAGGSLQLRDAPSGAGTVQGTVFTGAAGSWRWTRAAPLTNVLAASAGSLNVNQTLATCLTGGVTVISHSDSVAAGACPQEKVITRTWTAKDSCGNASTAIQTITVEDTEAPVLSGQGADATIECPAVPVFTAPTATDNCDTNATISFTDSTADGACAGSYSVTRTWIATDACGNSSAPVSQTITVQDDTAPVLSGQGANATIECPAVPSFTAPTALDNCDASADISFTDATTNGACAGSYSVTRTWIATDDCGNESAPVSQTITVVDTTEPDLVGVPADATVECSAIPAPASVTATDGCDSDVSVAFSESSAAGACVGTYTLTRTWTATDDCGNTASASQVLTVQDTSAPALLGVPADVTASCDAVPAPASVSASDNCDGSPSVTFSESTTPGSCANSYTITRTWTATDDCGNSSSASQTITVEDTAAPVLSGVPADVAAECDAIPAAANVTAADNCDGSVSVGFSESTVPGSCAGEYTIVRTWTATDDCGNTVSASQVITVSDTTAPVLSGQGADATIECPAVPVFTAPSATDNCDASPALSYTDAVTPGSSAGSYSVTRTWTATDACGNESAPVSQTITVVDTTAPVIVCPANQTIVQTNCEGGVAFAEPTATDACDANVVVTCVPPSGSQLGPGSHTIVCTATDAAGNSSTCSFTVYVVSRLQVVFDPSPVNDDNVDDNIETDQDVANKFKSGSRIPHKIKLLDCAGNDVTLAVASQVTVKLNVTLRQYVNATTSILVNDVPENYTGVGGAGGVMVVTGGFFHYNLNTTGYPAGTVNDPKFFRSHVTVEYNTSPGTVVGEEDALLESK